MDKDRFSKIAWSYKRTERMVRGRKTIHWKEDFGAGTCIKVPNA
jgi:hypothetical protein